MSTIYINPGHRFYLSVIFVGLVKITMTMFTLIVYWLIYCSIVFNVYIGSPLHSLVGNMDTVSPMDNQCEHRILDAIRFVLNGYRLNTFDNHCVH